MALAQALRSDRHGRLDMLPYARLLDLRFEQDDEEVRLVMPFSIGLVGSPGRLHGGAIAGLLEIAGLAAVILAQQGAQPDADRLPRLRPVTVTADFMREGTPVDTIAAAEVTRLGRRIINVSSRAWQVDRGRPIAMANINFLADWPDAGA
ncbi:PaaI family thioesterase [Polymorphobacter fuscus]|uniref:PaaI family thioesterase n=2 Tax=Sandarakinorhabdus fusca TaxID=1439888 RepID=A0A7C9GRH5_9SPHN|nr:PaaI family thioesterase [Polymorphobacter fuscus]MQT17171.1 PaaI family thioesterase [Polymorphobacter fuscus]